MHWKLSRLPEFWWNLQYLKRSCFPLNIHIIPNKPDIAGRQTYRRTEKVGVLRITTCLYHNFHIFAILQRFTTLSLGKLLSSQLPFLGHMHKYKLSSKPIQDDCYNSSHAGNTIINNIHINWNKTFYILVDILWKVSYLASSFDMVPLLPIYGSWFHMMAMLMWTLTSVSKNTWNKYNLCVYLNIYHTRKL